MLVMGWVCVSGLVFAETRTPSPAPAVPDSERFFDAYSKAVRFLREKNPQEAAIIMDQLAKQVTASHWK